MPDEDSPAPELSLAVPCFNESGVIELFVTRVRKVLGELGVAYEIVFVDDGSSDDTLVELKLQADRDPRIKVVALSRNFGKEAALSAGLAHCRGAAVVPIDVDLQEPPELIGEMLERWRQGYEVVTAARRSRESDSFLKSGTARLFYRVFNRLSETRIPYDSGDFRLLDRKVVAALLRMPERNRFMKGIFAWLGFRTTTIEFDREERVAGGTKFSYWKLCRLAVSNIFAFSSRPLRLCSLAGAIVSLAAFAYAAFLVARTLAYGADVPGYASLMVVMLFLGGIQLVGIGILGEYVNHIYNEVKGRPLYVVRETVGLKREARETAAPQQSFPPAG